MKLSDNSFTRNVDNENFDSGDVNKFSFYVLQSAAVCVMRGVQQCSCSNGTSCGSCKKCNSECSSGAVLVLLYQHPDYRSQWMYHLQPHWECFHPQLSEVAHHP